MSAIKCLEIVHFICCFQRNFSLQSQNRRIYPLKWDVSLLLGLKGQYFTEVMCPQSVWMAPSSWLSCLAWFYTHSCPLPVLCAQYSKLMGVRGQVLLTLYGDITVATRVGELNWNKQIITLFRCLRYFINCSSIQNIPGTQHLGFYRVRLFLFCFYAN